MSLFKEASKTIFQNGLGVQRPKTDVKRLSQMAAIAESLVPEDIARNREKASEELNVDEPSVRNRIAYSQHARKIRGTTKALEETNLESPEADALGDIVVEATHRNPRNDAPRSIEEGYVDSVLSFDVREEFEAERPESVLDVPREIAERRLGTRTEQIQTIIGQWSAEREERNPANWFLERFVFQSVPFAVSTGQTGIIGEAAPSENVFAGERVVEEAQMLFRAMVLMEDEEFQVFLDDVVNNIQEETSRFLGVRDLTAREDILADLLEPLPALYTNAFNLVDNAIPVGGTLISSASGVGRATRTSAGALRQVDRRTSVQASTESLGAERAGAAGSIPSDELALEVLPTQFNPEPDGVSSSGTITRDAALFDELVELLPTERLDTTPGGEFDQAVAEAQRRLQARYGEERLVDVQTRTQELSTGQTASEVEGVLLKRDGSEFRSERTARTAATRLGHDPGDVFQLESGGWGLRVSAPVEEEGFYTANLGSGATHQISRALQSGELSAGDVISAQAWEAAGRLNQIEQQLVRPTNEIFRRLSNNERRTTGEIWAAGTNEGRWFSRREFDERYYRQSRAHSSDRAWEAYNQARRVNDVEYHLRNDVLFTEMQTQGLRTIDIETPFLEAGTWNGRVLETIPTEAQRVFNSETGELVEALDEIPDGFNLVRLHSGPEDFSLNGQPIHYTLVRRSQMRERALERFQLNYRPGGHRMYDASYFVKRAARRNVGDQSILARPNVYVAARTKREAEEWVSVMEQARFSYRELTQAGVDPDDIRRIINEEIFTDSGRFDIDDFMQDMADNADDPYEVTLDRQNPSAYQSSEAVGDQISSFQALSGAQGRMYYSRRGERALKDYMGNDAPTLDMGAMLNRSLSNVARIGGFADFKTSMVNRWYKQYQDLLDDPRMTPFQAFINGSFKKQGVDTARINSAESQRTVIQNALGFRDQGRIEYDVIQRQFSNYVANQDWLRSAGIKDPVKFAGELRNWLSTQNPQAALMGAAFDLKLGLFNIAQIPLQMNHFGAIWQLSKAGSRYNGGAFVNSLPAYVYSIQKNPETMLNHLVRIGMHRGLGMDEAEYRAMMQMMRRSGKIDINGRYAMIGEFGTDPAIDTANGMIDGVRKAGRLPFSGTEGSMRASSFMIAWREARDANPNMDINSVPFQRQVLNLQRKYSFGMDAELNAPWQRGLTAIPTQFWGYFTRMTEAMFSNKFGKLLQNQDGQFSVNTPRMRLIVGQSALYGPLVGLPLANLAPAVSEGLGFTDPEPSAGQLNTFRGFAERGLIDHTIAWATGQDVLVSERFGAGAFVGDWLKGVFGDSPYGEVTAGEILGGASLSIWGDVLGDAKEFTESVVQYAATAAHGDTSGGPVVRDAFARMISNISTVNNGLKAHMIRQFGILQSSNQTVLVDGLDPSYSLAALFSVNPAELGELSQNFRYLEDRESMVSDMASVIRRYNSLAVNDPDNALQYREELRAFMRLFDNDPVYLQDAISQTSGQLESLYDVVQRRVDEARQLERLNEGLGNNG